MNLILWGTIIWLPALEYFLLRNEARPKKNIAVGVTLPHDRWQEPEVQAELARFRRELGILCLALTAAAVPCIFCRRVGIGMILYMVWIDLAIVLPQIPFVLTNRRLKALKKERGWQPENVLRTAELTVAAQPVRWLPCRCFLLPLAVSLLPLLFDRAYRIVYGCDAAVVLLCWFGYRWLYRNRAEAVDDNALLTETLTRLRRANWGRCWLWCAWCMAALNLCIWLLQDHFWGMMAATLAFCFGLTAAVVGVEFRTRRMQEKLTAGCTGPVCVDEDEKWIWGLFYYDPQDDRLMANQRTGLNSTFNLARPAGRVIVGLCALLLLAMPLLGVWMDHEERTPVTLSVSNGMLVAAHTGTEYEIPLAEITETELLDTLPGMQRTWGSSMDTFAKGSFSSSRGGLKVCLDPRTGPWLYLKTQDGQQYLLGGADGAADAYAALQGPSA